MESVFMAERLLGVIGGSGLYSMDGLIIIEKISVDTPFGPPSEDVVIGELNGTRMAFLPRHGLGHFIPPSEINFRANIFAMKKLGVEQIISVSAVGSMKEKLQPGHFAIPHQFIDRTTLRVSTFFTTGMVGHVALADPICLATAETLSAAAKSVNTIVHNGGIYVCIEGPQFSTKAESNVYRRWDVDIIGMTNATEAKLAREAGICYATLALVTDYDCWKEEEEPVTLEAVLAIMHKNVESAQKVLKKFASDFKDKRSCDCASAAKNAVVTDSKSIPIQLKDKLSILFG
jgi:5'-methylthioadenosine phosphorylase